MPDREKVMNWLKELAEPDWKSFHSISEVQIVAQDALALLKKQEAVEPFHRCIGKEFCLIEDSHFDYCPYCGKPITWAKQEGR